MAVINFLEVMEEIHLAYAVADYVMVISEQIFMFLSDEDSESAQGFTFKTEGLNLVILEGHKFCFRDPLYGNVRDEVRNIPLNRPSAECIDHCQICRMSAKSCLDSLSEPLGVNKITQPHKHRVMIVYSGVRSGFLVVVKVTLFRRQRIHKFLDQDKISNQNKIFLQYVYGKFGVIITLCYNPHIAPVAQRIERWPPEPKARSSNLLRRANHFTQKITALFPKRTGLYATIGFIHQDTS